ncbi:MAG: rhomboid family intramembrane serine protease [Candidatus Promineifilaceae bacterium]
MSSSEIDHPRRRVAALGRTLRSQLIVLGTFIFLFWFLELLDSLILDGGLDALGVQPRTLVGLRGVVFMPFLHDGFGHVLANTVPFIVLGWLVMMRRMADFFIVTAITVVISGLGVWLFGGNGSVHIGASGLIFGYFGFLLLRAYFERSLPAIAVAVVVGLLYGGLIWGVLPMQLGVSWQAHLFGFIGGVLAAYWLSREQRYGV